MMLCHALLGRARARGLVASAAVHFTDCSRRRSRAASAPRRAPSPAAASPPGALAEAVRRAPDPPAARRRARSCTTCSSPAALHSRLGRRPARPRRRGPRPRRERDADDPVVASPDGPAAFAAAPPRAWRGCSSSRARASPYRARARFARLTAARRRVRAWRTHRVRPARRRADARARGRRGVLAAHTAESAHAPRARASPTICGCPAVSPTGTPSRRSSRSTQIAWTSSSTRTPATSAA